MIGGRRWCARVATSPRAREGPPVVLVHGFGSSSAYFVPFAERLAAHFDVYAPDLPGHGKSAARGPALDLPELAAALREWLCAVSVERAALVANSMGCQIAAELAARHRTLVSRVVMIGPTLDREARSLLRVLPRFLVGGFHERLSMAPLIVRDYARVGTHLKDEFRAMVNHRIEDVLPRVQSPVLFVRGEHDAIAPHRWLEELVLVTPLSRIVTIADGGHAVHYALPEATLENVAPFLRADEWSLLQR
jgi:pimeloyl-ACP methyl ester carboxylesterase